MQTTKNSRLDRLHCTLKFENLTKTMTASSKVKAVMVIVSGHSQKNPCFSGIYRDWRQKTWLGRC